MSRTKRTSKPRRMTRKTTRSQKGGAETKTQAVKTQEAKIKGTRTQCSPGITAEDKILDASCFTRDAMDALKTAFNSHGGIKGTTGPRPRIDSSDPVKVWNHIREHIPECDRETCWIEKIADPGLKEKLQKQLFVPKRPKSWDADKNGWLSNYDILHVMTQYQTAFSAHGSAFRFIGPGFIDFDHRDSSGKCVVPELCDVNIGRLREEGVRYIGAVFNLDKHTGPGTHWVSVFIDISRKEPFFFYFNSTGEPIPDGIDRFRREVAASFGDTPVKYYSSTTEHQRSNTECGMYSLVFLVTMLTGERPTVNTMRTQARVKEAHMTMDQRIRFFTDPSTKLPDAVVEEFRHIYFR